MYIIKKYLPVCVRVFFLFIYDLYYKHKYYIYFLNMYVGVFIYIYK